MSRIDRLRDLALAAAPQAIGLRRALHRHPEVGWHELRTTRSIATALREEGLEPEVRSDGIGLVVEVGSGTPVVGWRADMDGLPIDEEIDVPFRSEVDGVMHACGHDAHAAIGAGIARVLHRFGDLPGTARFVFQPAEEQIPGGAVTMRAEGVHEGMRSILAYHVDPSLPPGRIGVRDGGITGASDRVVIELSGPGGHTSRPHQTVDLVYAAARIVTELPAMIRREVDPRHTALVVFGRIEGGHAANVIPTHIRLHGTVRLLDLGLWRRMPLLIQDMVEHLVDRTGATPKVDYVQGSPPVVNDPATIGIVREAAMACLGPGGVATTHQSLGSEDFAWYLEDVPGALIRLGVGRDGPAVDLHSAMFDLDESAFAPGILVGAEAMLRAMEA